MEESTNSTLSTRRVEVSTRGTHPKRQKQKESTHTQLNNSQHKIQYIGLEIHS
jgi:hypothetical protein